MTGNVTYTAYGASALDALRDVHPSPLSDVTRHESNPKSPLPPAPGEPLLDTTLERP